MNIRVQLTLASGFAVAMASAALLPLFEGGSWILRTLGAVLIVVLVGLAGRRCGLPRALQPLLGLLALVGYLCVAFAGSSLSYALVPSGRTLDVLRQLVDSGRVDIAAFGPPVPVRAGLVLISAAGVGAIAILVDLLAVVLDKAAVAGLPLLLLLAVPSAVVPGGLGYLPFVLGAAGWLSLLLVEGNERVGRWGTPMRAALPGARPGGDDSSLGRVGRRIGVTALGLSILVPAVIPGLDHRLLGGGSGAGSTVSGGSTETFTYNPIVRLQAELSLPIPRQLLLYETDDPQPDYLKMTTLDQYNDGSDTRFPAGWRASPLVADQQSGKVQNGIAVPLDDGGAHRPIHMRIAVDSLDVNWLPVPFGPTNVEVEGRWLWDPRSQTVFSASRKTEGLQPYTVEANRPLPDRATLAAVQFNDVDPAISKTYGSAVKVTPYVAALAQQLTRGESILYDKAVAIQAYFRAPENNFGYTLQASQPEPGGDALEAFLRGRQGFCQQYATAMAVLLRVAGIPSRVAVGFTPGTPIAGQKNRYRVTTDNAHAWPEAWFAGAGWVRFEPTPSQSGATVPDYTVPAVDPARPGVGPTVPATTAPTSRPQTGQLDPDVLEPGAVIPHRTTSGSSGFGLLSLWLVLPLSAAALSLTPLLLTLMRRRRRWLQPHALTAWCQLEDDAHDVGFRWHPSDSPRAAAARLAAWRRFPEPALAALERISVATERARYAPPGQQPTADLRPDVNLLRAELQQGSPGRDRWRARILPRSTLRWATQGLSKLLDTVDDKVDHTLSAVTRPLRRRTADR